MQHTSRFVLQGDFDIDYKARKNSGTNGNRHVVFGTYLHAPNWYSTDGSRMVYNLQTNSNISNFYAGGISVGHKDVGNAIGTNQFAMRCKRINGKWTTYWSRASLGWAWQYMHTTSTGWNTQDTRIRMDIHNSFNYPAAEATLYWINITADNILWDY